MEPLKIRTPEELEQMRQCEAEVTSEIIKDLVKEIESLKAMIKSWEERNEENVKTIEQLEVENTELKKSVERDPECGDL